LRRHPSTVVSQTSTQQHVRPSIYFNPHPSTPPQPDPTQIYAELQRCRLHQKLTPTRCLFFPASLTRQLTRKTDQEQAISSPPSSLTATETTCRALRHHSRYRCSRSSKGADATLHHAHSPHSPHHITEASSEPPTARTRESARPARGRADAGRGMGGSEAWSDL
jgi:hypothetical protein